MIEKILDFKDIQTSKDLGKYISSELNFSYIIEDIYSWDAYKDLLGELRVRELSDEYIYNKDDEWGWQNYNEFIGYKEAHKKIGIKNEKGVRDDMRLIFRNFGPFMKRNHALATTFLEFTTYALFPVITASWYNADKDDSLKIVFCIES